MDTNEEFEARYSDERHERHERHERRVHELFGEMESESDRGCILVGASAIDDVLRALLFHRLARDEHVARVAADPLFAGMGPLSTFSSRIKLVYALDLIPRWMFDDLERIRKVRNKAAHEVSAKTFESNEVVQLTSQLHANADFEARASGDEPNILQDRPQASGSRARALLERERFTDAVTYIAGWLDGRLEAGKASRGV
ncbi:MltR family transcriptional regulator [Variovorax sp. LT2P21]|uniref:MltR family transcriptional regulator n=1 Tax=Variovorax sp. LT2P21 TaxID=3443731 RepID=UPI003F448125